MILAYFFNIILATKFVFSDLVYIDLSFYKYYIFDVKSDVAFAEPIHIHDALFKKKKKKENR